MKRHYTDTDRRLFAQFIAERERYAPTECNGSGDCWVELGPPAMATSRGTTGVLCCAGCHGSPRFDAPRAGRYRRRQVLGA